MGKVKKKSCKKIRKHILCSITFIYNVEKYGRAKQSTDGNIIRPMRCAFRITKANNRFSTASLLHYTYTAYVVVDGYEPVNNTSVRCYHARALLSSNKIFRGALKENK
jgi:hypothetical protein